MLRNTEFNIRCHKHSVLSAFAKNAGPIIVSASLIDNIKERQKPKETDPEAIHDWLEELDVENPAAEEILEVKNIILSRISFNKITVKNWVIKKINAALYLFHTASLSCRFTNFSY